jgi:crotonobetainyl-CoA:carnitine CoA-transferase CaiB-like acyl-CoA transferase
MRLAAMGARCTKLEPLGQSGVSADPMAQYRPQAYELMHQGVRVLAADLKQASGQKKIRSLLANTDVLITSFRPSALKKLGLDPIELAKAWPSLIQISVIGSPPPHAEDPGHDLTYMAESGLVDGVALPASLFADMGGSLMVCETVLKALLWRAQHGKGQHHQVALSDAAAYLGLPRTWGLTTTDGSVGGAHAGYQVYPCKGGRVAVAALEPHFAQSLCALAGLPARGDRQHMHSAPVHQALRQWFATKTRAQLRRLAQLHDIPMHTL